MNIKRFLAGLMLGLGIVWLMASCRNLDAPKVDHWPTVTAYLATDQAYWQKTATETPPATPHSPTATSVNVTPGSSEMLTPMASAKTFAVPAYLPSLFKQFIVLPQDIALVADAPADLTLRMGVEPAFSQWVYALVAPFPTLVDEVHFDDLRQAWQAGETLPGQPLLVDALTLALFSDAWGEPANGVVEVIPTEQLLEIAWQRNTAWAIIPFDSLQPRWKVLMVDGQSPLQIDFDPASYPLTLSFGVTDVQGQPVAQLPQGWILPETNRDADKMTVLVMTGVTALVRGTSNMMYGRGITYPAQEIGPWLQEADITHISNEIAFTKSCPLYDLSIVELIFCTHPDYIGLLDNVGTDIVELTGDHYIDASPEDILFTLDLYQQRGWLTYGGGATLEGGLKAVTLEHNGSQFAFIGCNAKGGGYALASATNPGAAACDFEKQYAEVRRLSQQGYIVIATMQHQEIYQHTVLPTIRLDFTGFADAGATIVQGSQAHMPQNFEFYADSLIHYGLGNLFFDQVYEVDVTGKPIADKAFIDRHIFYAGRDISTELLTTQFVDLALSRPMTAEEREAFLRVIFSASGW